MIEPLMRGGWGPAGAQALAGCVQRSHGGLGRPVATSAPRTPEVSAFGMGATHVDVEPERLLARVVGLVPPPPSEPVGRRRARDRQR